MPSSARDLLTRLRARMLRNARSQTVYHYRDFKARWFYLGYKQALRDIDRTGIKPVTEEAVQESAERSLRAWVDTGSFSS